MNTDNSQHSSFQLPSDGYRVVSFLSEMSVKKIAAYYLNNQHVNQQRGFHSTMHQQDTEYRKKVLDILTIETKEAVRSLLPNYDLLLANYVVKNPGMNSDVGLHADWNYVDEHKHRSINIWCPLVDTNEDNGRLNVCPETHVNPESYRGTPFEPFNDESVKEYTSSSVGLNLKAGDAVLYDSSLVHFSDNNRTNEQRLAIALVMIPEGAQAIHCYHDRKELCVFNVDKTFFLTHEIGMRPSGKPVHSVSFVNRNARN